MILLVQVAYAVDFDTVRFDSSYQINADRSVDVTEDIEVTFSKPKHGITRSIPYRTAGKDVVRTVGIEIQGIELNGASCPFQTRTSGGQFELRIGDKNRLVDGRSRYTIRYRLTAALTNQKATGSMPEWTEFFWNVTPSQWPTTIPDATCRITFPPPASTGVRARIIVGASGSKVGVELSDTNAPVGRPDLLTAAFANRQTLVFSTKQPLPTGSLMTVVLGLPMGTVATQDDRRVEPRTDFRLPESNLVGGIIPLVALVPFWFWIAKKRDPNPGPLVVRFDPPDGAGPMEAGTIIDSKFDPRDVVAGMVSLAQKGYARIHSEGGELSFELLDRPKNGALERTGLEETLRQHLWSIGSFIAPEVLRGQFRVQYDDLHRQAFEQLEVNGLTDPKKKVSAMGLGCLGSIVILAAGVFAFLKFGLPAVAGVVIAVLVLMITASKISIYRPAGRKIQHELRGLREFISRANKKEFEYMVDRVPDQTMFETLLPYAIAFGMVKQWANAFEGILIEQPDWYAGDFGPNIFWYSALTHDLDVMSSDWSNSLSPVNSSDFFDGSGGGFSSGDSGFGGGFDSGGGAGDGGGGGGGGDW